MDKVKQYIQKLMKDEIGPDRLTMKTDHPTQVIKYGMKVKLIDSNTARETIDRFSA